MASSAATPDTPITLKITYDGATRRFKLPLRDLGAASLEDKLRGFLNITSETETIVERYSDSASAYIVLDSTNPAVYKQLLRAAKAKQKLKLRVSAVPPQVEETASYNPVAVEDAPETSDVTQGMPSSKEEVSAPEAPAPAPASAQSPPTSASASASTITAPQSAEEFPEFLKEWRTRGMPRIHLRRDVGGKEVIDFLGQPTGIGPLAAAEPIEQSVSLDKSLPVDDQLHAFSQTASPLLFDAPQQSLDSSRVKPDENSIEQPKIPECPAFTSRFRRPFTVCCNSCDRAVPDAHFHCSTCDDGDFDLCQDCVNQGISCYNDQHWLIKRTIADGQITYSTTHVAPKVNRSSQEKPASNAAISCSQLSLPIRSAEAVAKPGRRELGPWTPLFMARTCNSCVQEFPEKEFLHCNVCEDFDLCKACFGKDQHGHHPKHSFAPAVKGTVFDASIMARLSAGRNVRHNAICDGCNHYIRGIRHKCLDCPDWDYCSDCAQNAGFIHPNHRFAPIFEPLAEPARVMSRSIHNGICCDGPLCASSRTGSRYIVGTRYKCAVCHDTDFCSGCEASPANTHNKTHPLIKLRTPVRHVSVTTTGEHKNGERLPTMGDRQISPVSSRRTNSRSTETIPSPSENIAVNPMQTVIDVKPTEAPVEQNKEKVFEKEATKSEQVTVAEKKQESEPEPDLIAVFKRDTIEDGTAMPPNHTFEQTWVLRNEGKVAWPAGCSVKFVGGDYMGAVDPTRPTGVRELISASESTVCYNQLQPGQEFPFTVLMRTPEREGKVISYWRLTSRDGIKFGHKLWCDVTVEAPVRVKEERSLLDTEVPEMAKSQMIIPRLDHESPAASVLVPKEESELEVATETDTLAPSTRDNEDDLEDCADDDDDWAESDGGFMTDEEYDILDASDEEFLFEQQKMVARK